MSNKFSSKPSCDGKKFFIEVTGIQHGPEQDFEFFDLSDMTEQEALEQKKAIDPELEDTTIYSWDWCNEDKNRNVWLKIDSEEGSPIKLPLFQNVSAIARKPDTQDYLLHAVLPLTLLPTYDNTKHYKERLAPVRAGFIYVFYNNKVWREIQIRPEDNDLMSFKDVDLLKYRSDFEQPFNEEDRVATGAPLKELWLPAKENNKTARIHLAFSEVQWSAQRLNYLEANQDEMAQRTTAFHLLNVHDNVDVIPTSALPELRMRAPELELFLAEPSQLSQDLSGEWLNKTYQAIKSDITSARNSGSSAVNNFKYEKAYQYEYAIKHSVLKELITSDASDADNWRAEASNDFLQDAKQRQLRAIVLDDPLFDLRHHAFLTQSAVGYLQQVYVDMSKQKYYRSAELVQKFVVPDKFGKQENPLYEFKDDFDAYLGGRFHRTLRTIERNICTRDAKVLQKQVESLVNDERVTHVLRDFSSQNDINAAAAHVIAGYALSALSLDVDKLDQMSNPESGTQSPCLKTAQRILSPQGNHPLHKVLFPEEGAVSLDDDAYTPPEPFNSGSGLASPKSLALWSKDDWIVNEEQLKVMDLAFLVQQTDNGEDSFSSVRNVARVLDEILRGYFEALMALSENLVSEAQVLQFNSAYAPVLGLMKATNSKLWGDITFKTLGKYGSEFNGTILGVEGHGLKYGLSADDRKYLQSKKKTASMGRLYDKNGKLLASTNKTAFSKRDMISGTKAKTGAKLPLKVVAVSQESRVAEALNQANTRRALRDISHSGTTVSNAYETLRVPYFIVVIELINIQNSKEDIIDALKGENHSAVRAKAISALADLSVASVHASNLYTQNASQLAIASQKTAITMPSFLVRTLTFDSGKVGLVSRISYLGVASIGAGFLTAGISAWESAQAFEHNDTDAGMAMGMVATGTLITTVATGFFTTSTPWLFGMGPVAWFGIALSVVGLGLYMYFKDTPMEVWLKNGPFGEDPSSDYTHLQDPTTAFDRFVGLMFNLSANAYRLGTHTLFPSAVTQQMQALGATHVIHVDTNLASILNPNTLDIHVYIRQAIKKNTETRSRVGISNNSEVETLSRHNLDIIHQEKVANGYAFFVKHDLKVPEAHRTSSFLGGKSHQYVYNPIFILRARMQVEDAYFPTLPLDEADGSKPAIAQLKFNDEDKHWLNREIKA